LLIHYDLHYIIFYDKKKIAGLILDERYSNNPDAAQTSLATVLLYCKVSRFEEPPGDAEPKIELRPRPVLQETSGQLTAELSCTL
jgi:hypothetical protein